MNGDASWFEQLEARLEQQLEAFLRANPAQEALLQNQEQQDRQRTLRERRITLQHQAESLRAELLELAAEIQRWQQRVSRARQAGAEELAARAEAHRNALMEQGRQRWQLLVALGEAFAELETRAQPDLDQAWARFEAEQELEALRRRQGR